MTCIECHSRAAGTARTCGAVRSRTFCPVGHLLHARAARVPASAAPHARTACGILGGSKDAAEELLVEVLAELKSMETADWGLLDTRETQPAAGDTKYYSGL